VLTVEAAVRSSEIVSRTRRAAVRVPAQQAPLRSEHRARESATRAAQGQGRVSIRVLVGGKNSIVEYLAQKDSTS